MPAPPSPHRPAPRAERQAQRIIETWRIHYNERRPHSSLGYLTPVQYAARGGALRSPDDCAPRPLAETTRTVIQTERLTL